MPVQGIKAVATARNGVGAFILPCRRLDLHYCDFYGSSRGMNSLLASASLLPGLAARYPSVEFHLSPRPNHHPVLKAHYLNGAVKAVCVRNLEPTQILQKVELLLQNSGAKNRKIRGKNVVSLNEGVRGGWSALHGGLKAI